jgi:hypothetical protein
LGYVNPNNRHNGSGHPGAVVIYFNLS